MPAKHKTRWIIALAAGAVAAAAWFTIDRFISPAHDRPHRVILVTLDTLRADHLSMYDHYWDTSPFLAQLADEGALFKNTIVSMPTTAPSHASIVTGLYPIQNGVLKNGHQLADDYTTLAELYKQLDYRTAAFISARPQFLGANFQQGFDVFDVPDAANLQDGKQHEDAYRSAQQTIDKAVHWIRNASPDDPFFLWIHLFDPHWPLMPPEAQLKISANALMGPQALSFMINTRHLDMSVYGSPETMMGTIAMYDAEIRYVDDQLRRLHKSVHDLRNPDDTVWAITTDHGEGLGAHHWYEHGKYLYGELTRAATVLWSPNAPYRGKVIERVVENVDLFPTLIQLIANPDAALPRNEGQSLWPLITDQTDRTYDKTFAFAQRRIFEVPPEPPYDPATVNYEAGSTYSIQTNQHKLIHKTEGDDELYDLINDPYELHNILADAPDIARQLRDALDVKLERLEREAATDLKEIDAESIKELEGLGYAR
ncbi:MAG: hypothetical protein CMJ49_14595 [Planctomycetaceae bacterium]|nr:hypothetical protein [Planctomycetaceae bacterium]